MIQYRLWFELEKVAARYRLLRFWQALAAGWLLAALIGFAMWGIGLAAASDARWTVVLLCTVAASLLGFFLWQVARLPPRHEWVAHQIELQFPELRTCLLAAIEQRPDLPDGRYGYLQSSVIQQALEHAGRHAWPDVIPTRRIAIAAAVQFAALVLFLLAVAAAVFWASPPASAAGESGEGPSAASGAFSFVVEPGNAEIERGTSLLVLARVAGAVPPEATLVYQSAGGEETRLAMSRSLADPVFGARVASVQEELAYHVELGGQTSPTYRVTVFEYPRLERADARLVFPSYTKMEERLVQDVHTVSVVEGTELTLICRLNKPVASATLSETNAEPILLASAAGESAAYQATIRCDKSRRLKLDLVDEAGRRNVQQWDFVIRVLPNQPPTLKPVFPARDMEVSPLEELDLRATAWDDFGLARYGITYSMAGQPPVDVTLAENAAGRERHNLAHAIRFEELKAEPDQLLAYHLWAEDFGPDGKIRRTQSDMYFAEVRPFEEIYRQGEQPPGGQQQRQQGQGQNTQAAQQLAQLQKEIINATWKLIRREIGPKLTDGFGSDVEQVHLSQSTALEQATTLAERLQDPQSQEHVATVLDAMKTAATQLESAKQTPSAEPLKPALAAEQAAYQALLKLRAREHEVIRQQRQQSSSSSSSSARSQQQRMQMQQLDLKNEENRYETQRMAQSPQEEQQDRENRQVLNRLRELARRQNDLNERLKELQSALAEAQTPQQREEIRQQLKRLQEEQRQILRDTDELQSRMESPENQERMSQERQQLEQTRDEVRRASEALEQEMVTQAAASGSRAQREFQELRDEFRRRASNRFSEEMRQMRESARQLDQKEQEIGQRLAEATEPSKTKSLRQEDQREPIAEELGQQRQRLNNLTEQMRQTIQDAEQAEPLLSERLYDTARQSQNQNPDQALEAAARSTRQGLLNDAQQQEEAARRGIGQLREGIERAAEGVLGDETEALRRAREELENLAQELNQEIDRNAPGGQRQPGQPQEGQRPSGQKQGDQKQGDRQPTAGQKGQGEPSERQGEKGQPQGGKGQPQPGENQPGENQPGESQPGENQPGQNQPGQGQGGQGQPQDRQAQEGQPQQGSPQQGQPQEGQPQEGQPQEGRPQAGQGKPGQTADRRGGRRLADSAAGPGAGPFEDYVPRDYSPLSGEDFRDWSDRLRDVEEMVSDPELRGEAARIRERARAIRVEANRHSAPPNWELVQVQVAGPLFELRDRVAQELLRRTSKQALVPLDRDPVPPRYSEKTRRYYQRLGSGK